MSQSNTPDANASDTDASDTNASDINTSNTNTSNTNASDINDSDTNTSDTKVPVNNNVSNSIVSMDTFMNDLNNSYASLLKSNQDYKSYSDIERDFKYVDSLPPADLNFLKKDVESIKIICSNIMYMSPFGKHIVYYLLDIICFILN